MAAPRSSGSVMSTWLNSDRPALKLMNVLTTATEAREMAVAAGIPSSRTSPEDWRVKRPCAGGAPLRAAPPGTGALALFPPPDEPIGFRLRPPFQKEFYPVSPSPGTLHR